MNTELKARAKRLKMAIGDVLNVSVTTAQSLELVAKEENFPNWDAASACARQSAEIPSPRSALSLLGYRQPLNLYVIAPAGVGKRLPVTQALMDHLAIGKTVYVLDCGFSYFKVVELVGGTFIELRTGGDHKITVFGNAPLVVYEFEGLAQPCEGRLPNGVEDADSSCAVIIDETLAIQSVFPGLSQRVAQWAARGVALCITGQYDYGLEEYMGLSAPSITMRLTKNHG